MQGKAVADGKTVTSTRKGGFLTVFLFAQKSDSNVVIATVLRIFTNIVEIKKNA